MATFVLVGVLANGGFLILNYVIKWHVARFEDLMERFVVQDRMECTTKKIQYINFPYSEANIDFFTSYQ